MRHTSFIKLSVALLFIWTCGGGGGGSTAPEPPQLPTVTNIEVTTLEDTPTTFAFTGTDPLNSALSYSVSTQPQHGAISINGGAGTYTPSPNYNGQDVIAYIATSINGNSNIGTIIITITAVDDEPNTMDVAATTDEDNAVTMTFEAEEVDGQTIQFNVTGNPSNGSATIAGTTATYTPNQDWNGTDTFNFEVVDSSSKSILNNATATITVNPINDAPLANNMSVSTDENRIKQLDITLDVTDVDGDNLTYSIVSDVSDGTTSITNDIVTYTPNQDWNGTDTFTFKANDGTVDSNIGTVTIGVSAVNDAPTVNDITLSTNEDVILPLQLDGNDIEGDSITYSIITSPSNGALSTINGNLIGYAPLPNWNGTDTFTYKANDGTLDSNIGTVTITVAAINDAPSTNNISQTGFIGYNDYDYPISLTGSDIENDNLTFSIVSSPSNGSVSLSGNVVTYTADGDGEDSFTFQANDGTDDSNISTVSLNSSFRDHYLLDGQNVSTDLYALLTTDDGGYYIAGRKGADNNFYMEKVNSEHQIEWDINESEKLIARSIEMSNTSDGGFILSYSTYNNNYAYFYKVSSSGQIEWERWYQTPSYNINIKQIDDGSYLAIGYKISNIHEIWIINLDNNGNIASEFPSITQNPQWGEDKMFDIKSNGDIYIIGKDEGKSDNKCSQLTFSNNTVSVIQSPTNCGRASLDLSFFHMSLGSDDGILVGKSYDHSVGFYKFLNNSLEWSYEYTYSHGNRAYPKLYETLDGNYIALAQEGSPNFGSNLINVFKLDTAGQIIWNTQIKRVNDSYVLAYDIGELSNGNFIITSDVPSGFIAALDSEGNRIF